MRVIKHKEPRSTRLATNHLYTFPACGERFSLVNTRHASRRAGQCQVSASTVG